MTLILVAAHGASGGVPSAGLVASAELAQRYRGSDLQSPRLPRTVGRFLGGRNGRGLLVLWQWRVQAFPPHWVGGRRGQSRCVGRVVFASLVALTGIVVPGHLAKACLIRLEWSG